MSDYTIKQMINNRSVPPTIYDEPDKDKKTCICIAQSAGKFGVVTESGAPFLPFEYDNISMAGFSLYLLIKNGKMGVLHAPRPIGCEDQPFEIRKLIPCEYDMIEFPKEGSSFVFLRKDTEKGSTLQIYFTESSKISEPFRRVEYSDFDYVIVTEKDHCTEQILDRNGNSLFTISGDKKSLKLFAIYETDAGTVFPAHKSDGTVVLVLVEKIKKAEYENRASDYDDMYELTGTVKEYSFDRFIRPILAGEHIRTLERDYAIGFILEQEGKYIVLDGKCEKMCKEAFCRMTLETRIEGDADNGMDFDLTLRRIRIDIDPYEEF